MTTVGHLTVDQQNAATLQVAQAACKLGYHPAEVREMVRMDDPTYAAIQDWYNDWTHPED